MNLLSPTKYWLSFRGRTLLDELYLIKAVLLFFLLIVTSRSALFDKKYLFKENICVVSFGITFFCRKRTLDFSYILPFYEKTLFNYFHVKKGIFVDVGTHTGRYSLFVAKHSENVRVLSFEPTPVTYNVFTYNVLYNNFRNVFPLRMALSSKKGQVSFFINPTNEGENSLVKSDAKGKIAIVAATDTLDNVLKANKIYPPDVALMKIDVEGAENLVLEGAIQTLTVSSPTIIFEANSMSAVLSCAKILNPLGYSIRQVTPTNFIATKSA